MNRQQREDNGFTMIELVVCIIIVAILAAMAVSYYEHAIEEMRMSDVLTIMGTEISAQERYMLTKHHYTKFWHQLDAAPVQVRKAYEGNRYSNGLENTVFFTRGKKANGEPAHGFQVYFEQIGRSWFITADRVGSSKYKYTLIRPFNTEQVFCLPNLESEKSILICTDFMGVNTPEELLPDPRLTADL